LLSSLVENGAGTGWTVLVLLLILILSLVNLDKLSNYRNMVYENPTRCEEILLFGSKCSSLKINGRKKVTDMETIRLGKRNLTHQRLNVGHLILQFSNFNVNKNSLSENKEMFHQWLVGFVDGDGTFSIIRQNNKWNLTFKIGQSTYNLRVLHFIKKELNYGSLYIEKEGTIANFRIRDLKVLESIIFPIFDKYPLLTSKHFNYIKFKQAHAILSNNSLTLLEKDTLIFNIINTQLPLDYISPAWSSVNNKVSNFENASKVMSKSWLIGFTEAGYYTIVTTNSRAIENIIQYYKNTMKGMKSVEYRIWSRSYVKNKGNFIALNKIRENVRIMKTNNYTLTNMK